MSDAPSAAAGVVLVEAAAGPQVVVRSTSSCSSGNVADVDAAVGHELPVGVAVGLEERRHRRLVLGDGPERGSGACTPMKWSTQALRSASHLGPAYAGFWVLWSPFVSTSRFGTPCTCSHRCVGPRGPVCSSWYAPVMCDRHVDLVDVGDQRAGPEPLVVGLVEALHQRVVERWCGAWSSVLLRAAARRSVPTSSGLLGADDAGGDAAEQVVRGADAAGPQRAGSRSCDAARVRDAAVQVVDQARQRRSRGGACGRVAAIMKPVMPPYEWPMSATSPFDHGCAGDPLVDDVLAVLGALAAEEVELAARAAGAAHRRVDR